MPDYKITIKSHKNRKTKTEIIFANSSDEAISKLTLQNEEFVFDVQRNKNFSEDDKVVLTKLR